MSAPRTLPLFDEKTQPASWNERMTPSEYAVHDSIQTNGPGKPFTCTVFSNLAEAEAYAEEQVAAKPDLRCRIYDHHGFARQPVREIRGSSHKGDSEISPRFRRWVGSVLFLGGLTLIVLDWSHDFSFAWPAMIGFRLIIPGALLVLTEIVLVLQARHKARRASEPVIR